MAKEKKKRKPYGYSRPQKYFQEHPEEYEAYKQRVRDAQKKFMKENPERWREIQKAGEDKWVEMRRNNRDKENIVEEYFGKE